MAEETIGIEAALKEILQTWPSNQDYLEDLKERAAGSGAPLVPFVGAGLSMSMGFPSWGGFLKALARECGLTTEVETLLDSEQYEEAAEAVQTGMSVEVFNDRLAHIFGERRSRTCELRGPVLALPGLSMGPVITTNFDQVLERVFDVTGQRFARVVWGSQVDLLRQALGENKPFLLKIHGDAEERVARVLTRAEFDLHYAGNDPNLLRAQLGRLFQSRTLLFLGCSLQSDRTMEVLLDSVKAAAGLRHFAVLARPQEDAKLYERSRWLGEHAIRVVWYPYGRYDLIEPLLKWIGSQGSGRGARKTRAKRKLPGQANAGGTGAPPAGSGEQLLRPQSEETTDNLLQGSRTIQIIISQHFRIADLLIYPERVRGSGLARVLNSGDKMRRALNRKKRFPIGTLGMLSPVATIEGYSNEYWRDGIPEFRKEMTDPQLWFFPFELSLTDYMCKEQYDAYSMLQIILGDVNDVIANRQVSARLRIYPPGVGVIRLAITLTFREAVVVDLVARIAQDLEAAFFVTPKGDQKPFQDVLVKIIDEVADALFTELKTSGSERRWRPPEIAYVVHDDESFVPQSNLQSLTQLLSLAPENSEHKESLAKRLSEAIGATEWHRDGVIAFSSVRVALLFAQQGDSEPRRRLRSRTIQALLETGELIAAGAYSLQALLEELTGICAKRSLVDLPQGRSQIEFMCRLLRITRLVLQAIAAAKLDLSKRRVGVLMSFAAATWRNNNQGVLNDLRNDLRYIREWTGRQANPRDQIVEDILHSAAEILALSDPFRRARQ